MHPPFNSTGRFCQWLSSSWKESHTYSSVCFAEHCADESAITTAPLCNPVARGPSVLPAGVLLRSFLLPGDDEHVGFSWCCVGTWCTRTRVWLENILRSRAAGFGVYVFSSPPVTYVHFNSANGSQGNSAVILQHCWR